MSDSMDSMKILYPADRAGWLAVHMSPEAVARLHEILLVSDFICSDLYDLERELEKWVD